MDYARLFADLTGTGDRPAQRGRRRAGRAAVAAILVVSALGAAAVAAQSPASATSTTRTLVVTAEADTMVKQASPAEVFGTANPLMADGQELRTEGSAVTSYLRFDVTGVAEGGTVTAAALSLRTLPTDGGTTNGPAVWRTEDTATPAAGESMTFDSGRPARSGTVPVGNFSSMGHDVRVATAVTGITGNGVVSLELAPESTNGLRFRPREDATAANHPQLVLTVGSANEDTPTEPDTTAPTVTAQAPAAQATSVPLHSDVTATFSEAVSGVSEATFVVKDGTTSVPAEVTYDSASRTATLNPNATLASGTTYTAELSGGIADTAGNPLASVSWTFTTATPETSTTRTLVVTAEADTMVKQASSTEVFGAANPLLADGQELSTTGSAVHSYLRFDVAGLAEGETVTGASLSLRTLPSYGGTTNGPAVWRTGDTATAAAGESMTWDASRPARVGTAPVGNFSSMGHDVRVATAVTGITGNGVVSLELAPESTNGLFFRPREDATPANRLQLVLTVSSTDGAPALAAGVTQRAVLNDPPAHSGRDYAIHAEWIRLIDGAPGGAVLDMSTYAINYPKVTDALIRAKNRGVEVRFVYNGRQTVEGESARLRTALGSGFTHCDQLHPSGAYRMESCVGTRRGGFVHTKLLLVSESGTLRDVVNVSSSNPTYGQAKQYNDAVTTAGDPELYAAFRRVFDDMAAQRKDDDYATSANGHLASEASLAEAWISPKADSDGGTSEQASTDLVVQTLRPLRGGAGCRIRMEQRHFDSSRDVIAKEFARLRDDGGCSVQLLYGQSDSTALGKLHTAGVTTRLSDSPRTHEKFYIVEGTYAGMPGSRLVFAGSHNIDRGSLRRADDVLISYRAPEIVDTYAEQFDRVWAREG